MHAFEGKIHSPSPSSGLIDLAWLTIPFLRPFVVREGSDAESYTLLTKTVSTEWSETMAAIVVIEIADWIALIEGSLTESTVGIPKGCVELTHISWVDPIACHIFPLSTNLDRGILAFMEGKGRQLEPEGWELIRLSDEVVVYRTSVMPDEILAPPKDVLFLLMAHRDEYEWRRIEGTDTG